MTTGRPATMLTLGAFVASAFLVTFAAAQSAVSSSSAPATKESRARIVRLSDVEGPVKIERAAGEGLEKGFLNMPVVEGSRLKTGEQGRAEIEFEDGSTVRIGGNTELAFTHLALGGDGEKLNTAQLVSGTLYANVREKKGDQFQINLGGESVTVPEAAHFRVVMDGSQRADLAVFKGKVDASGPAGKFEIAEKHQADIDLATTDAAQKDTFVIAKNYDQEALDGWDRQQDTYHERYANAAAGGASGFSSPFGYGVSDLSYYGSFNNIPGYGYSWQPFFMNAAWNPFMDGGWAFYPGMGYMWVSGYPWGWMPYNYGNWGFAQGYGWFWQPGGWNNFSGMPRVVNAPAGMRLPAAPASGHQTLMVGRGLMAVDTARPGKLTIKPGSAGFGVPRGSVNHLDRSARAMEHNPRPVTVSTARPPQSGDAGFGGGMSTRGGQTMRPAAGPSPTHQGTVTRSGPHK